MYRAIIIIRLFVGMLFMAIYSTSANAKEQSLAIITSFSEEISSELLDDYRQYRPGANIDIIYRKTESVLRLLNDGRVQPDVVLSSSPFLFNALQKNNGMLDSELSFIPFAYSETVFIYNQEYLKKLNITPPDTWQALAKPEFHSHITMSSPSRSGTTHIMVESILQQYGWDAGWQLLLEIGGNLRGVSARSFGVSESVSRGVVGVGPVIDSYALKQQDKLKYITYRPIRKGPIIPVYYGVIHNSANKAATHDFLAYLQQLSTDESHAMRAFKKHAIQTSEQSPEKPYSVDQTLMLKRSNLVKLLFDKTIVAHTPILQQVWGDIHQKEKRRLTSAEQHKITQAKQLLSTPIITQAQSESAHVLQLANLPPQSHERVMFSESLEKKFRLNIDKALDILRTIE